MILQEEPARNDVRAPPRRPPPRARFPPAGAPPRQRGPGRRSPRAARPSTGTHGPATAHPMLYIHGSAPQMQARYGITVQHVKLKDTAEAVTRVVAEKAAAQLPAASRSHPGSTARTSCRWRAGTPALRTLHEGLPNSPGRHDRQAVERRSTSPCRSTVSNCRGATTQIVHLYDGEDGRGSALGAGAARLGQDASRPPRASDVRNFLGATFLKQALYELATDPAVLQTPATDDEFRHGRPRRSGSGS